MDLMDNMDNHPALKGTPPKTGGEFNGHNRQIIFANNKY